MGVDTRFGQWRLPASERHLYRVGHIYFYITADWPHPAVTQAGRLSLTLDMWRCLNEPRVHHTCCLSTLSVTHVWNSLISQEHCKWQPKSYLTPPTSSTTATNFSPQEGRTECQQFHPPSSIWISHIKKYSLNYHILYRCQCNVVLSYLLIN